MAHTHINRMIPANDRNNGSDDVDVEGNVPEVRARPLPKLPGPAAFIKDLPLRCHKVLRQTCYTAVQLHRPHVHVKKLNREASPLWLAAMDTFFNEAGNVDRNYSRWEGERKEQGKKFASLVKTGLKHDHQQYNIKAREVGSIMHDCEVLAHVLQNEITEAQLQDSNCLNEEALVQANRNVLNNQYEAQWASFQAFRVLSLRVWHSNSMKANVTRWLSSHRIQGFKVCAMDIISLYYCIINH